MDQTRKKVQTTIADFEILRVAAQAIVGRFGGRWLLSSYSASPQSHNRLGSYS